ncbi:MAG: monovalent cation/H+ antiporter subunit D family protein [Cyclobacteriaceae bacterium]|nr:monovalent cation/H+ antiporter subunit D family protein [Cyclobacteriaceae bacterium]
MEMNSLLLILILFSSLVPGILILLLHERQVFMRSFLNLLGAVVKVGLVAWVFAGYYSGEEYVFIFGLAPDLTFALQVDHLGLLFAALSAVLWLVTTIYAIGYLEGGKHLRRFFAFFSLCVTASTGIALSGNVVTFFVFYEFLTLSTYPLVVHRGDDIAVEAGRTYLWYTIGGGTVLFLGVVGLFVVAGPVYFGQTEIIANLVAENELQLTILFFIMLTGLAVKAAIFPFHGWLPIAMVAPAPVSALLHAVAVVKAGAFGIVRLVYDVYGIDTSEQMNLLTPLAVFAAFTIIYGSLKALFQDDFKKVLAYSTISQLSYIALGVAITGVLSTTGAVVHLVHQGIMKITMFFAAGNVAETYGYKKISQLNGIGRRMPLTMGAFTIAAFGMIGLPPIAGFVSKWYLGLGAIEAESYWVVLVLLASSAMNAAYFLPIVYRAWFCEEGHEMVHRRRPGRFETPALLLIPVVLTGLFSLAAGVFAASANSPLSIAREIAERLYLYLP